MGWSCESKAGDMMERIFKLTKEDGFIHHNGTKYIVEPVYKEYPDGRIKIEVWKAESAGGNPVTATKIGHFFIMPGGKIAEEALARFPFLKDIAGEGK